MLAQLQSQPVSFDTLSAVGVTTMAVTAADDHFHTTVMKDSTAQDIEALEARSTVGASMKFGFR